jgi:phage gp36-like protein
VGSYSSSGQAYATRNDLAGVISAAALTHPSTGPAAQDAQLLRASEVADSYLRSQYKLPLVRWGSDIVDAVCNVAAYKLVCLRGFNPEADESYLTNYNTATKWLRDIGSGVVTPDVIDSSASTVDPGDHAAAASPSAASPAPYNSFLGNRTRGTGYR